MHNPAFLLAAPAAAPVSAFTPTLAARRPVFAAPRHAPAVSVPRTAGRVGVRCAAEGAAPLLNAKQAKTLKVGSYFGLWYAFNVAFNLVNKALLNMWCRPWTLSTIQLGVGAVYCTTLWTLGLRQRPTVTPKLLKAMFLPSLGHALGHVLSCISFSAVAISFSHIVKSAEPAVGAVFSALLLGEVYHPMVYLSLLPIIGGVALCSATELTFNWFGFATAMSSNFAFAGRNVFSKMTMGDFKNDATFTPQNSYGLISIIAFLMQLPFCLLFDGIPSLLPTSAAAIAAAVPAQTIFMYLMASSLLYHLYNETSYLCLNNVSPVSFSIGNTIKRICIIFASIIFFKTTILPLNALGCAIAIFGTGMYAYTKNKYAPAKPKEAFPAPRM